MRRFHGVPPFQEMQNYVQRVNRFRNDLEAGSRVRWPASHPRHSGGDVIEWTAGVGNQIGCRRGGDGAARASGALLSAGPANVSTVLHRRRVHADFVGCCGRDGRNPGASATEGPLAYRGHPRGLGPASRRPPEGRLIPSAPARRSQGLRSSEPVVHLLQQLVDGEKALNAIGFPLENGVIPALHADGAIEIVAHPQLPARNELEKHLFVR